MKPACLNVLTTSAYQITRTLAMALTLTLCIPGSASCFFHWHIAHTFRLPSPS